MNTEYSVGNFRIHFESRARRRWFVALFYAVLAAVEAACIYNHSHPKFPYLAAWIVSGLAILWVGLMLPFSWLTDDMRMHGDERETHRREHASARAYRTLRYFILAGFFVCFFFPRPNPIPSLPSAAVRAFFMELPYIVLSTVFLLCITLPQAILLWTEPDMEEPQEAS